MSVPFVVWLLSAYHTGSHRAWARGYQAHSQHRVVPLTMAGRFWKWRMQGGSVELAAQAKQALATSGPPHVVMATDMVHLSVWRGLLHDQLPSNTPLVLYMHENQLTYPWRPGEKPDLTYAMINWLSQLSADEIWFNSHYHRSSWFDELPRFLKHYPDYNHLESVATVQAHSLVVPVGIDCGHSGLLNRDKDAGSEPTWNDSERPDQPDDPAPLILWNQRWEYDKRPDRFFALLYALEDAGIPFRLAVAGENFRKKPDEFEQARTRLAQRIVHWGYLKSRRAYLSLLQSADLVVSTADHEFFGISVLEAIWAGAFPLLPRRLSYPELVPVELHPACLYQNDDDLFVMARHRLTHPRPAPPSLRRHVQMHYDWPVVARTYDVRLRALAGEHG